MSTLWTFGSSFTGNEHLYPEADGKLSKWGTDNFQGYYDKFHDLNGPGKDVTIESKIMLSELSPSENLNSFLPLERIIKSS